jgi:uncharacterized coiled-coil DUF342 family protein
VHDVEEGRKESGNLRSERDTIRTERDALRAESEDLRKTTREYDELVANKDKEMASMRSHIAELEKSKADEMDRLKTRLIEMGDQVSNALKFQDVSSFYYLLYQIMLQII